MYFRPASSTVQPTVPDHDVVFTSKVLRIPKQD